MAAQVSPEARRRVTRAVEEMAQRRRRLAAQRREPERMFTDEDLNTRESFAEAIARHEARDAEFHAQYPERTPGWTCPVEPNKWPLYPTGAVTLDTPYGPVTVGRSLARMYDLTGWPEETVLRDMVETQGRWAR